MTAEAANDQSPPQPHIIVHHNTKQPSTINFDSTWDLHHDLHFFILLDLSVKLNDSTRYQPCCDDNNVYMRAHHRVTRSGPSMPLFHDLKCPSIITSPRHIWSAISWLRKSGPTSGRCQQRTFFHLCLTNNSRAILGWYGNNGGGVFVEYLSTSPSAFLPHTEFPAIVQSCVRDAEQYFPD